MTVRLATAAAAALLSTTLAGCGMHSSANSASIFGGKVDNQNIGLATRAQMALAQNNTATAIPLAERAVAASPDDAGFRGLLGNVYFAGGRFASAESAYRDSLALTPAQPQVVLKLALVSIAQGKSGQAIGLLDAARAMLDPADFGLAMTLAGQPREAAEVLRNAAAQVGADARVRQNLALALALSGDWTAARTIAAQDVPADQLDARIQQWMQLAKPARASDQVAALTGVTPAASDPGQPARLALKNTRTRVAAAAPTPAPARAAEPAPAEVAAAAPVAVPQPDVLAPAPARLDLEPGLRIAAPVPAPALSPRAAALPAKASSGAVVQLGAFASKASVAAAWSKASARFPALRGYTPVAARFDGERGTVYRLAVHGFASAGQAAALCGSLKRAGAACFVRPSAGDAPVRIASR